MPPSLSPDEALIARVRAQRLGAAGPSGVADVVSSLAGVQAQHTPAARLAIRSRTTGLRAEDVDRAYDTDRAVVRTWAMRGTLHMVAATDLRWMVELLGPLFIQRNRRRRLQLGLDDDAVARALPELRSVLTDGPLTRAEIVRALAGRGIALDPRSQAPPHLLGYAAARGVLCRGPDMDRNEPTYVLISDWVPPSPPREPDDALAALARRYLAVHAPAGPLDFAAWSGLPRAQARRGFALIADEVQEFLVDGVALSAPAEMPLDVSPPDTPVVRLLGHFDEYLLGWRDRSLALDPAYAKRIQAGGGMIMPAVLVNGRVLGTWKAERRGERLTVAVAPFGSLPAGVPPMVEAEAADIGRFLGLTASLTFDYPAG